MRIMITKPFFTILFLACLFGSGKSLTITHQNQYYGQNFNYDSLKIFNWNMGSDHCQPGETFPNCDSYIKESVDKLISMGDKYDILCLQEVPKFDRSQQKATADKFINDFVLKYKYAIFRKESTNIAILSKFPIQNQDEIQLSMHYGAQRIQFQAEQQTYQVVNIHSAHSTLVPSLETRKEDIRKTLRWMNSTATKFNFLSGVFNMPYSEVEKIIIELKPFGLDGLPPRSCPGPIYCTLAWGEKGWPYTMEKMSNRHLQYGVIYTKSFQGTYRVLSNRAVTLKNVQNASLDIFGDRYSGADLQAQLIPQANSYDKFILQSFGSEKSYLIVSPFDRVNYLRIDTNQNSTSPTTLQTYFPLYWTKDYKYASKFEYPSLEGACPRRCYLTLQQIYDGNGTKIMIAGAETSTQKGFKPHLVVYKDI